VERQDWGEQSLFQPWVQHLQRQGDKEERNSLGVSGHCDDGEACVILVIITKTAGPYMTNPNIHFILKVQGSIRICQQRRNIYGLMIT
jgi:hypothetical protein